MRCLTLPTSARHVSTAVLTGLVFGASVSAQIAPHPGSPLAGPLPAIEGVVAAATCDVNRNNEPHHYVSSIDDPVTGRPYSHEIFQPPGFFSQSVQDPGIATAATSWRWIPSQVNMRYSTRQVTGFYVFLYPTASTLNFPFTGYIPEWSMQPTRLRTDGGFEPDPTQPPHILVPQTSFVFVAAGAKRARTAFSVPIPVDTAEVCLQYRWQGGEHRLRPASQSFVGTAGEAPWTVPTWGYADPIGTPMVVDTHQQLGQHSTLWGSYYEAEPSIVAESDYAHERRLAPNPPNYSGFCDAAGLSDLAQNTLRVGWNVDAGAANAGAFCVPMFNLSQTIAPPPGVSLGFTTLEVDLANSLLTFFAEADYVGFADQDGWFDGPRATLAPMGPSAVGWYLGMEFLISDPVTFQIRSTTQAHWIEILP